PTPVPTVTPTPGSASTPTAEAPASEPTVLDTAPPAGMPPSADTAAPADMPTPTETAAPTGMPTPADTAAPADTAPPMAIAEPTEPALPTEIPAPASTAAATADRELAYGVNAYLWSDEASAASSLTLADQAGFGLVRQRFAWNDIEPEAGAFQWERADRVVQQVNERGLTLLVQLAPDRDEPAFWGVPLPQHRSDFVRFVAAVAARYACTPEAAGCINAYQI